MTKSKQGRSTAAIDDHVAARIRERRLMMGLTQRQLAETIGVTSQQVHNYEHGVHWISVGRLYEIAQGLKVPVEYFYEEVGQPRPRVITPHRRMVFDVIRNFGDI